MTPEERFLLKRPEDEINSSNYEAYVEWLEKNCLRLEDFDEHELVDRLKDNYFDFIDEVEEDEMVEYLERHNYIVTNKSEIIEENHYVDHNDLIKLEEIKQKFINASWVDREIMYKVISSL